VAQGFIAPAGLLRRLQSMLESYSRFTMACGSGSMPNFSPGQLFSALFIKAVPEFARFTYL
jgi:hypothetical protein